MAVGRSRALHFGVEWIEAPGVTAPELAVTWSLLRIRVDDELVTQTYDHRTESVREGIEVPTYPLALWIVRNWYFLLYHRRPLSLPHELRRFAGRSVRSAETTEWQLHHNLRAVGDGMIWPDFSLISATEVVEADWWSDEFFRAGAQIRYLNSGGARIDRSAYIDALRSLVEATLARLEDRGVDAGTLAREWSSLLALDEDEEEFCISAARLGLDPFDVPESVAQLIIQAGTELEAPLLADFLEAVEPELLSSDLGWLETASSVIRSDSEVRESLPQLTESDAPTFPAGRGLRLAAELRSVLGIDPSSQVDPLRWLVVHDVANQDRGLLGLGGRSSANSPVFAVGSVAWARRRFAAARALFEFVTGADRRFLVTTSRLPEQQANRAFAAEFLAPVEGIERLLVTASGPVPADEVDAIAEHFSVSPTVIEHQIQDGLHRTVISEFG